MDKCIVNREKSLAYLRDKIIEFFKSNDYVEGSFNDNRFVEYCHKVYQESWDEDVFDIRDLELLLWSGSDLHLSVKILLYLKEEKGPERVDSDVFCQHEIEYINWAFSDSTVACTWDVVKYRDYIEDDRHDKEINKAHRKWQDNAISNWWLENKDKDAWDIDWGDKKPITDFDSSAWDDMLKGTDDIS